MNSANGYPDFIVKIKDRIRSAQYEALRAVNKELVGLYWDIGRIISEKQKELGWGKSVIDNLAKDLEKEFPSQNGFSARNLRSMVLFYSEYKDFPIWQPLVAKIGFSHNMLILSKCHSLEERKFYITASSKSGWTKRVLDHQIDNKTFEKYLLNQNNYDNLPLEKFRDQRVMAIKDHYTFNFLELSDHHTERELEVSLIRNIERFLIELGGELSYIGSQYKISLGNEDFYIDLLLFHRELQCLIAIELKVGPFKPEYKGKMEFYLNVLNDFHRKPFENEAIGIIICKSKSRLVVEYSLKKSITHIGVASYSTGPDLPDYYGKALPTIEQIERGLGSWMVTDET